MSIKNNSYSYTFFFKTTKFLTSEPQIFENHSNLVSNSQASNKKFLASSINFIKFCLFSLHLNPKLFPPTGFDCQIADCNGVYPLSSVVSLRKMISEYLLSIIWDFSRNIWQWWIPHLKCLYTTDLWRVNLNNKFPLMTSYRCFRQALQRDLLQTTDIFGIWHF